jgi:hypothetical protein
VAGEKNLGALGRELLGDCGADRTASTEHNRYLALQCLSSHGDLRVSSRPIDVPKAYRRTLPAAASASDVPAILSA